MSSPLPSALGRALTPWAACLAAALAGCGLTVAVFWPGFMSYDSVEQLGQARAGTVTDWHPPVMAVLWGWLDRVVSGPGGMLLFHNLVFWAGLGLAVHSLLPRTRAAGLVVLALGALPVVFGLLSTVWKDVGMGAAVLFGAAFVLLARRTGRPAWLVPAALAFLYGLAARKNAATALLPLFAWAGVVLVRDRPRPWLRGWALGAAALVVAQGLVMGANHLLVRSPPTFQLQTILIHDLVGVSLRAREVKLPPWIMEPQPYTLEDLAKTYTADNLVAIFCSTTARQIPQTKDPAHWAELQRFWLQTVREHPGAWLAHRAAFFSALLGVDRSCYPFHDGIIGNDLGIEFHPGPVSRRAMAALHALENSLLFRPWVWLAALLALMAAAALLGRQVGVVVTLGTSGVLYLLPYFVVGPTCDFRYAWWTVLSALLSAVALAAPRE